MLTHTGHKREINQDQCLIKKIAVDTFILAVADGLGGHAAGETASAIARETLSGARRIPGHEEKCLSDLINEAHRRIRSFAEKKLDSKEMGTTATAMMIHADTAWWAHVGDSRIYLTRNGIAGQATCDQNMAWFLLEEGEIDEEEFFLHPSRNLLDQCLGQGGDSCEPETGGFKLVKGDQLALMTDGVHGELPPKIMLDILTGRGSIEAKAKRLETAALDAGGSDNITIVMAEI